MKVSKEKIDFPTCDARIFLSIYDGVKYAYAEKIIYLYIQIYNCVVETVVVQTYVENSNFS